MFTYSRTGNTYTCNCFINGVLDTALTNTTSAVDSRITSKVITEYRIGNMSIPYAAGSLYYDNYRHFDGVLSNSAITYYYNNDGTRPTVT